MNELYRKGDQKYHLQPYLPNAVEYRLFFIGNEFIGTLKKTASPENGWHNIGQGGQAEFLPPMESPMDCLQYAELVRGECPFDYGAIDFLALKNSKYFLEVNLVPGFEAFEKASTINIAGKLVQLLTKYQ